MFKNSLVRDFSLDVKMDSKMVTQEMYHSGKNVDKEGDYGDQRQETLW